MAKFRKSGKLRNKKDVSGQIDVENEEIYLRCKNLLSWQNILNSRQTAVDIGKK